MSESFNFPNTITFSDDVVFYIDYFEYSYTPNNRKGSYTITERKGCIVSVQIHGFSLSGMGIIAFMSLLESFLKNQLPTDKAIKLAGFAAKAFVSQGQPLLALQKQNGEHKKTFSKLFCNYILNCYNTVKREFNICSATMFPSKTMS